MFTSTYHVDSMVAAGINSVRMDVLYTDYMRYLDSLNLKVLPIGVDHGIEYKNAIIQYTGGKYSKWEPEGEYGDTSYLLYDHSKLEQRTEGDNTFIRLKPVFAHDSTLLIHGPYTRQDLKKYYPVTENITYNADFVLKLERIFETGEDSTADMLPDTTSICQILVTHSIKAAVGFELINEIVDEQKILRKSDFDSLNIFKHFTLIYGFADSNDVNLDNFQIYHNYKELILRQRRDYIQYKIVWYGRPGYTISIDKVLVYDEDGANIINQKPTVLSRLNNQLNFLLGYNIVDSWLGIDEPDTYDNYEPMKAVNNILKNAGYKIQYPLMGKWDGVFENRNNKWGTYHLSPWKEIKKRVGEISACQNFYSFDYPYQTNNDTTNGKSACNCTDFRAENISRVVNNYQQAHEVDSMFGASIQCGEIHNRVAEERNINTGEFHYAINLALLCGAKFLSLYTYFAQRDSNDVTGTGTKHGIVDSYLGNYIYTDKYYMLRNVIGPRLRGLYGNTLAELHPLEQFAGNSGINFYPGYSLASINHYILDYVQPYPFFNDSSFIDYGFFTKAEYPDKDFIMILNRYYSVPSVFMVGLKTLTNYNNWKVKSYTDSVEYVLNPVNGLTTFIDTLTKGEAGLYSIAPVVKYGGELVTDEYIYGSITLKENPIIVKPGVHLTIDGNYSIKKNITVERGATLVIRSDAHINLLDSAKIIVKGTISGAGYEKSVISFGNTSNEISMKTGGTLENLKIDNAYHAVTLIGDSTERGYTTTIKNVEFNSFSGFTGAVGSSILIQDCKFRCQMGIYLGMFNDFNIIGNTFNPGTGSGAPAIQIFSSSGKIRNNIMHNYGNGIFLGNSTADIGGNQIYNNSHAGIYIGSGSLADLQGRMISKIDCPGSLIFYSLTGYNQIYNNGTSLSDSMANAEIAMYRSNILLENGGNVIADDRDPNVYDTQDLLCGSFRGDTIYAKYNDWGSSSIPLSERFGSLNVAYEPIGIILPPEYPIDCKHINFTNDLTPIDTLEGKAYGPEEYSYLEELFSYAYTSIDQQDYATAYTQTKNIVDIYYNNINAEKSYQLLYDIRVLQNASEEEFIELKNYYNSKLPYITDEYLAVLVKHLAELCDVSSGGLAEAMAGFNSTITQYPGTEQAIFAEIDMLTASLLDTSSSLGKSSKFGKVNAGNYTDIVQKLLEKQYGKTEQKFLPTEYSIFQNYPNPFNPVTTIQYDVPKKSIVSIKVYDILGREAAVLINEESKEQGRYQVQFNASRLASGVYFYKINSDKYQAVKKMMLIK